MLSHFREPRFPAFYLPLWLRRLSIPTSLSGLLTARFLLHVRRWDYERSGAATAGGSHFDSQANSVVFRAAGLMSTIVEEFGSDPVTRASESQGLDREDPSTTEGSVASGSNVEKNDINSDLEGHPGLNPVTV